MAVQGATPRTSPRSETTDGGRSSRRARWTLVDRLLPPDLRATPGDTRRGRFFLLVTTVLAVVAVFFAREVSQGKVSLSGRISLMLMVSGVVALLNIPLAWAIRSVRVPAAIASGLLLFVSLATAFLASGLGDPALWFVPLTPLVATYLVGPRAGSVIAAVGCAGAAALFFARESGYAFLEPAPEDQYLHAVGLGAVLVTVAMFSAVYESMRADSAHRAERALEQLRAKNDELKRLANEVTEARDRAIEESGRKGEFIARMHEFSAAQADALERTRVATTELSRTIRAIAGTVAALATESKASDGNIDGVARSMASTIQTARDVVTAVEDTSRALQSLTAAVASVEAQMQTLASSASSTASVMVEMQDWSGRVELSAARTVQLSDEMIREAERGREAVNRALAGVDGISASSSLASEVIHTLEQRVSAIGAMNQVIEEVAVETNVLALNASIIAAQAGERGHGFIVVADQIKALAARTARSTREIAQVIRAAQQEMRNAVTVIDHGEVAVQAGVELTEQASRALEQIVVTAREATEQMRGIEQATAAQARRARGVGQAMGEVTRSLGDVVRSTGEHARAVQLIENAMGQLRAVAPEMEARAQQQGENAAQARASIARMSQMAVQLDAVQGDQTRASEATVGAVLEIQRAQQGQLRALEALEPVGEREPHDHGGSRRS